MDDGDSTTTAPILSISHVWFSRQTMTIPVILHVGNRKVEVLALIDSGAAGIFIDHQFIIKQGIKGLPLSKDIKVFNVDGTENKNGSITEQVTAGLDIKGRIAKARFLVTALGTQKVILGYPWLVYANPKINWRKKEFSWWDDTLRVNIYEIVATIQDNIEKDLHKTDDDLVIAFTRGLDKLDEQPDKWIHACFESSDISINNTTPNIDKWITDKMTPSQALASHEAQKRTELDAKDLIPVEFHKFLPTVFSERPIGELPSRKKYDHAIDLKPDFIP